MVQKARLHRPGPCSAVQCSVVRRTTFGAVIVNVNKRSVSADARTFTPNYLLGVSFDLFNLFLNAQSKVKSHRDSNDNLRVNSIKV